MYKVYWTDPWGEAGSSDYEDLAQALSYSAQLREDGNTFVTMVSENPNSVGKPGVDSVIDGKLPNGDVYEWKMRRTQ